MTLFEKSSPEIAHYPESRDIRVDAYDGSGYPPTTIVKLQLGKSGGGARHLRVVAERE
jgi:hypothetical protein